MLRAVLFDLDGVIRHFATDYIAAVERRHGISAGTIARFAFADDVLDPVITGVITRHEWIDQIGERVGSMQAAAEFDRTPSIVDPEILALVNDVHASGHRTAILTNGTDTVRAEIDALGLAPHFEHVFNSADIGFAKPDARAFQHALDQLALPAADVLFTDDSANNLPEADALGMPTHLFRDASALRVVLRAHGVDV
ncbi:HAD-IA family hydrolase [Microbacterium sp.]|uniref:HAD-IA family hydrolase n=1 Tax=Microbacterium sp. TaxID=51671 RepID=UPI003F96FAE5